MSNRGSVKTVKRCSVFTVYQRKQHVISGFSQICIRSQGWRVFATTELPEVEITTDRRRGAIGVDLNADHLAVADTDASGNYLNAWRVPLVTYGKNTNQAEALIGDAVASVVQYATGGRQAHRHREAGLPPEEGRSGGTSPANTPGCCRVSATARSRRISCPVAIGREWRSIRSTRPTVPSSAG